MNNQNLKPNPITSGEQAKRMGSKGGKASAKAKKEKKLMSQIYADILAEQTGQKKGLNLKTVVKNILQEGGSPAVSMLKEIRESTEGQKMNLNIESAPSIKVEFVKPNDAQSKNPDSIRPASDGEQTV